jgi:hypothetical protein
MFRPAHCAPVCAPGIEATPNRACVSPRRRRRPDVGARVGRQRGVMESQAASMQMGGSCVRRGRRMPG